MYKKKNTTDKTFSNNCLKLNTLTVLLRNVGHFSSSAPFMAALPRNKSIEVPGGNKP